MPAAAATALDLSTSQEEDERLLAKVAEEFAVLADVDDFNRVAAKVRPLSASPGCLVCELVVGKEHVNAKGTLHGGFSAALVDVVTARAMGMHVRENAMASVEIAASYILPIMLDERIEIVATVLKVGRSLIFTDIEFRKEDYRIAVKGKHTAAILPGEPPRDSAGRPIQY